jgi:hypothetical protein
MVQQNLQLILIKKQRISIHIHIGQCHGDQEFFLSHGMSTAVANQYIQVRGGNALDMELRRKAEEANRFSKTSELGLSWLENHSEGKSLHSKENPGLPLEIGERFLKIRLHSVLNTPTCDCSPDGSPDMFPWNDCGSSSHGHCHCHCHCHSDGLGAGMQASARKQHSSRQHGR